MTPLMIRHSDPDDTTTKIDCPSCLAVFEVLKELDYR